MADEIRADYTQLQQVATQFNRQAAAINQMQQQMKRSLAARPPVVHAARRTAVWVDAARFSQAAGAFLIGKSSATPARIRI